MDRMPSSTGSRNEEERVATGKLGRGQLRLETYSSSEIPANEFTTCDFDGSINEIRTL